MAFHSKKDFAEKCGMETKVLSVYIKRKKVVLSGDYVDDSLEQNKYFLARWKEKKGLPDPEVKKNVIKKEVKAPVESKPSIPNTTVNEIPFDDTALLELERRQELLEIEKTEQEIIKLKLNNDKQNGIVVPTEMVKILFAQHTKSILVEFSNSVDKIITKISKRKSMNNNEIAEIRKELIEEINIAVDKSVDESKKNIKNVVAEFSEKKGKGERN